MPRLSARHTFMARQYPPIEGMGLPHALSLDFFLALLVTFHQPSYVATEVIHHSLTENALFFGIKHATVPVDSEGAACYNHLDTYRSHIHTCLEISVPSACLGRNSPPGVMDVLQDWHR